MIAIFERKGPLRDFISVHMSDRPYPDQIFIRHVHDAERLLDTLIYTGRILDDGRCDACVCRQDLSIADGAADEDDALHLTCALLQHMSVSEAAKRCNGRASHSVWHTKARCTVQPIRSSVSR